MNHFHLTDDGRCIARDEYAAQVVHDHFVSPIGAKGSAYNVTQFIYSLDVAKDCLFDALQMLVSILEQMRTACAWHFQRHEM